eukprot:3522152-Pyramimonas_sp.AAC.1
MDPESPKTPPRRSKRAPSHRTIVPGRPRWPQDGLRRLQDASRGHQGVFQEGPQRPKSSMIL